MVEITSSIFVFLLGLSIGSFLNVCIFRTPRGQSIVTPSSRCTSCGMELSVGDLIPVIGYIMLRGRCRGCGEKISVQYPLVELSTAILFTLLYFKFSLSLELIFYMVLVSALSVACLIDLNTMEIPDSVTIPGTMFAIVLSPFIGFVPDSLLGAAFGFVFIYVLGRIAKLIYKREAVGEGDAMLFMMIGAYMGPVGVIQSLFLSFVVGGVVGLALILLKIKKFGDEVVFGPMAAAGTLMALFFMI